MDQLGPRLARRILDDANNVWSNFIDDAGENQISVSHATLVKLIANVWGPSPPKHITSNSSLPDLRKIETIGNSEGASLVTRRSSIRHLVIISEARSGIGTINEVGTEITEEGDDNSNSTVPWIPGPLAFDEGVKLAKKSLENHVVPGFLTSFEFLIYQKRCNEMSEMIKTSFSLSKYPLYFRAVNDTQYPIVPTTTVLDNSEFLMKLKNNKVIYSLDLVLSDRYLFDRFLAYLNKRYCPEALLCYRSLQLYRLTYR